MEAETNTTIKYNDFISFMILLKILAYNKMICNSSNLERESAPDPSSATMLATKLKRRKHFKNYYCIS